MLLNILVTQSSSLLFLRLHSYPMPTEVIIDLKNCPFPESCNEFMLTGIVTSFIYVEVYREINMLPMQTGLTA